MPKQTFFNLSEEKRNRIISATYSEFIEKSYEKVNIRSISSRSEINVASFYQYFTDKEDLYLYLLTEIAAKISAKGYERYGTLFLLEDELDLTSICTEEEIKYEATWYKVPITVMRKFYFGDYNKALKSIYRKELDELKSNDKLSEDMDEELILHMIVTGMFNLQVFFKDNDIIDKEKRKELTHQFYNHLLPYGFLKR